MSEVDYSSYSRVAEPIEATNKAVKPVDSKPTIKTESVKPIVQVPPVIPTEVVAPSLESQTMHDLETKLETIGIDNTVIHKKFGKGTVVKIN